MKAKGGSRGKKERDPQHGTKGTEEDREGNKEEPTRSPTRVGRKGMKERDLEATDQEIQGRRRRKE